MVVNSVMNRPASRCPAVVAAPTTVPLRLPDVLEPTPSRTRSKKSLSWWRLSPRSERYFSSLTVLSSKEDRRSPKPEESCWATRVTRAAITANPSRIVMSVARLRGSPQRCRRSAIGDAIAESSRPMMTGTSTTDSCPNTRRNT